MKQLSKYIIAILVGLAGVQNALAVEVAAAPSSIQDASSKIESSHGVLLDIKDSASITDAEKDEKSIVARKNIIRDAISLALIEIENVNLSLSKLPPFEAGSTEAKLKLNYTEELAVYSAYYKEKTANLEKIITIEEAKALAKEIADYRSGIYNPSIEKMGEFSLIFYAAETMNTATIRLSKMIADLLKLDKLNIYKIASIQPQLDKAAELIKNSSKTYLQARSLVLVVPAPILEEAPLAPEETSLETEAAEPQPTAKELIEASLTDIKLTYDIFIQISQTVRKSLGLK